VKRDKKVVFEPPSFLPICLSTYLPWHYNTSMPTVRFPAMMKYYVNNQAEFFVPAATVSQLLNQVIEQYPSIKFHLVDAEGKLRRHFNVFVNGTHIRELGGMDTPLSEADKVILMASAAGGS
jgi:molybdopterin converting factor small subunit